jgi:nucleotide-binding universal stress UspA family protein
VLESLSAGDDLVARRVTALERGVRGVLAAGDPDPEVVVGVPAFELAAAARDADLLVVGARHLTPLERLGLGSTSETLCQAAPCSILLVPAVT